MGGALKSICGLSKYKKRGVVWILIFTILSVVLILLNPAAWEKVYLSDFLPFLSKDSSAENNRNDIENNSSIIDSNMPKATEVLAKLEVKGRAPKTGYSRDKYYDTWPKENGCNLRQRILKRDFGDSARLDTDNCTVIAGSFYEPYTGEFKNFTTKSQISKEVQIDHVVALSDAWQKGAQYKSQDVRFLIATDPLNLIAVDASANMKKSDGDAATWLPKNKRFRCQYISRQISVKYKYSLWVTEAEKSAMERVLTSCPEERAIGVKL